MHHPETMNDSDSPYFTWTEELAIGHEQIDADHQNIFELANRLQAELQDDPEYPIVGEALVELIDHTGGHFGREEDLMQEVEYGGYEAHKREHELLMQIVNELHRKFMQSRGNLSALSMEVSDFIRKAMVGHILHSDLKLGRWIRERK